MIAVIDYGLGNLRSICAALDRLGVPYEQTSDKNRISQAQGLILPGVGAFPDGMRNLQKLDLVDFLDDIVLKNKRPILGVCLGFQLMASEGQEFSRVTGLGWFNARVVRMDQNTSSIRIPHVGWNDCLRLIDSPIFSDIPKEALFYFTHSYHMECLEKEDVLAVSEHGKQFVAAAQKGKIYGTQFHPEKSQLHGLSLIKNFVDKVVSEC